MIQNFRVVAFFVPVPRDCGQRGVGFAIAFDRFRVVPLLFQTVQILVEPVHEKRQQFLGILLIVPTELRGKVPNRALEARRSHDAELVAPHALKQIGIFFGDATFVPERVVSIDFCHVILVKKVLREPRGLCHALQGRVHKARVAEVPEADSSRCDRGAA